MGGNREFAAPRSSVSYADNAPLRADEIIHSNRPLCMYRLLFANDFLHAFGSRSYVSGLLIDTRVV
ncbi:hypothetical protein SAMN05444000_1593, partial [Shimia gijangensis]